MSSGRQAGWSAAGPSPLALAVPAAAAGACIAAVTLTASGRLVAVAVVGAVVVTALFATAGAHFEWFVLGLLATRATIDITDPGGYAIFKPASVVAIAMMVAGAVWLLLNRNAVPRRRWSAVTVGLAGYTVIVGVGMLTLENPTPVAADALAVPAALVMLLAVERLLILGMPLSRLVIALLVAALLPLVVPAVGPLIGLQTTHLKEGITALKSTFVLSNNFAHFLVAVILVTIPVAMRLTGRWRAVAWAVVAAASVEIIFTNTRGAWIGVIVGVLVLGLFENRRLLIGLVALVAVAVLAVPGARDRIADLSDNPRARRDEDSLQWRLDHWSKIVHWNEDQPLVGIGFGMVRRLDSEHKAPHNDYLRAYVETGYLGLAFYVTFVIGFLRTAWRARRRVTQGWEGGLTAGIFAFAAAFAAVSLAENLIATITFMWYAVSLAAIANWIVHNSPAPEPSVAGPSDVELART